MLVEAFGGQIAHLLQLITYAFLKFSLESELGLRSQHRTFPQRPGKISRTLGSLSKRPIHAHNV